MRKEGLEKGRSVGRRVYKKKDKESREKERGVEVQHVKVSCSHDQSVPNVMRCVWLRVAYDRTLVVVT